MVFCIRDENFDFPHAGFLGQPKNLKTSRVTSIARLLMNPSNHHKCGGHRITAMQFFLLWNRSFRSHKGYITITDKNSCIGTGAVSPWFFVAFLVSQRPRMIPKTGHCVKLCSTNQTGFQFNRAFHITPHILCTCLMSRQIPLNSLFFEGEDLKEFDAHSPGVAKKCFHCSWSRPDQMLSLLDREHYI